MDIQEAKTLAIELMDKHGCLDRQWHFELDNSKRRFGVCRYRTKTISLSRNLIALNEVEKVKDVILHEIAHVLAGHKAGHGAEWVRIARSIGCDGLRCYGDETVKVKGNYIAICKNGHEHHKFKKPTRGSSCGKCIRRFNPDALLVWEKVVK